MGVSNKKSQLSSTGTNSDAIISGGNWVGNTYTGVGEKTRFSYVIVNLQTDEDGTLIFEFSQDNINWGAFPVNGFPITGGINEVHGAYKIASRYFRICFVGTGGRTYFRLLTEYTDVPVFLSSPLSQGLGGDQDATTVKAVLHGEDVETGNFAKVQTSSGAIRTSIVSSLISFSHDYYEKLAPAPSDTTDRYDYYTGGVGGTKVAEVLITYETTAKGEVLSAGVTLI